MRAVMGGGRVRAVMGRREGDGVFTCTHVVLMKKASNIKLYLHLEFMQ